MNFTPIDLCKPWCFRKPVLSTAVVLLSLFSAKGGDYPSTVLSDSPLAYYRLNDSTARSNINVNAGSLGDAGNATNLNARAYSGAVAGDRNRSQFYDSSARAVIPFNAALNPDASQPFTMEAWFYPSSDQINAGQAVINNRYAYSGATRQGWVIFQRAQDTSYTGKPGFEGVGWNFRMYRGSGSSSGLDVVSQVPYVIGKWTHVAVVYDPSDAGGPTVTMFIDGVEAASNTWTGDGAGYKANTDDHDPTEAVNGPSGLAFGSYNNTQPGSNPYFGGVDEFAFYAKKLSAEQILGHYQSGTNSARALPYATLVQSAQPVAYLRMDELSPTASPVLNLGDLRNNVVAENSSKVQQQLTGPILGSSEDGAAGYHLRNGAGSVTDIPWVEANNPVESVPFTFEAWVKADNDRQNPGASPVNNRYKASGNRTGWVIFQRAPNETYAGVSGYSGVGWNFKMYTGVGSGGQDVVTSVPYVVGEWQHLVFTWQPDENGDTGNGNWTGALTAFVNGQPVSTNASAIYKANQNPTEDGSDPADLSIGAYNKASGLGDNPFEGAMSEVALYNNYVLTPEQVLAHYHAATNSHPATNYETLVLTAAYTETSPQRLMPATYLRLNDAAPYSAANSGTLGAAADAALVATINSAAGPEAPTYPGFPTSNSAISLDSELGWLSLNNPAGLNFSGKITMEAWIKPGQTLGANARIISHGPQTLSVYDGVTVATNGSVLTSPEVFLSIDGAGANYVVGSSDGTNSHTTSFAVPAGDLGGDKWIHLAGTYDGTNWNLFRNGAPVASSPSSTGAIPVNGGGWAVGSSGNGWADNFTGSIDEVAIYDHALSASQIASHYSAQPVSGFLKVEVVAQSVVVTWLGGTLQSADSVTGVFTAVAGATSPYTPPSGPTVKFYRWVKSAQ